MSQILIGCKVLCRVVLERAREVLSTLFSRILSRKVGTLSTKRFFMFGQSTADYIVVYINTMLSNRRNMNTHKPYLFYSIQLNIMKKRIYQLTASLCLLVNLKKKQLKNQSLLYWYKHRPLYSLAWFMFIVYYYCLFTLVIIIYIFFSPRFLF